MSHKGTGRSSPKPDRRRLWLALPALPIVAISQVSQAGLENRWAAPVDGSWIDGSKWSLGVTPKNGEPAGTTYDAFIDAIAAPYAVSLNAHTAVDNLTINSPDATFVHSVGTLTASGSVTVSAGAYELRGATLAGATLTQSGAGRVTLVRGVLQNVQVAGDLAIRNGTVTFDGSTTHVGGRISIESTTNRAVLRFGLGDHALAGSTEIVFDGTSSNAAIEQEEGTLTLGANVLVRTGATGGDVGFQGSSPAPIVLVNNGTISARTPGKSLRVAGATVYHNGTFEALNGATLVAHGIAGTLGNINVGASSRMDLYSGGPFGGTQFDNARPIALSDGAYLTLGGKWTNSGPVTVDAATLEVAGAGTNTGTITLNGGTLRLGGTISLGSASSELGTVSLVNSTLAVTGSVRTSQLADFGYTNSRAVLTGALNNGVPDTLTLFATGPAWYLDSGGTLYGAVNTPDGSVLRAIGVKASTLSNVTLNAPLIIEAGATVNTIGLRGRARIDNAGTLTILPAALAGFHFTLDGAWSNTGTIVVNGATLHLAGNPTSFGNITASGTATLGIATVATPAQIRALATGTASTVAIIPGGTLNNTGDTVDLHAASPVWRLSGGTIDGGTIASSAGKTFTVSGTAAGTLDAVTLAANTDITGPLKITGGLTVNAPLVLRPSPPPASPFTGPSLLFHGDQSLGGTSEVRVDLPGFANFSSTNGTLTILPETTVRAVRGMLIISGSAPLPLVNRGTIRGQGASAEIQFGGAGLVNNGLVESLEGATVAFYAPVSGTGSLSAGAGSTLKILRGGTQSHLAITGSANLAKRSAGGQTLLVNDLQLAGSPSAWTGKLDLADNALVLDYAAGAESPLGRTADQIRTGRAGGTWAGNGVTTSAATAGTSLGYAEAGDVLGLSGDQTATWLGQTVDATSVLVRYTLLGDANIDGAVDFLDLVRLAQNYNSAGGSEHWFTGDFNYDGDVDFVDLVVLAQGYNAALPAAGEWSGSFDAEVARAFASVPEPSVGVLPLAAGLMALRRRRRGG